MDESKKELALKLLEDLEKTPIVINQGEARIFEDFDKSRIQVIGKLRPLINQFLEEGISLEEFKISIDSTNKLNPLWGFRGVNGQMFFNMLFNSSKDKEKLKETLKEVLRCPENIVSAKDKINVLIDFIKVETFAEDKRALPRTKSTLYFLSYFWQLQKPEKYPVFYNSLEQSFTELGFLNFNEDLANYYGEFFDLNMEFLNLFKQKKANANLWYVEHVFWKYYIDIQNLEEKKEIMETMKTLDIRNIKKDMSFIPEVISNLAGLSLNESNPSDFEKKTGALFTILGFEAQIKGQGKGRMVDVIAKANTSQPYILLIDCKARSGKDFRFNAGEERTVIEYIKNFSHDYPQYRRLPTYYLIVSSGFKDNDEFVRRKIRSETAIGVSFITAETLLFLVNKKLQTWDIDLETVIKEVFQIEGIITEDIVQDIIGR